MYHRDYKAKYTCGTLYRNDGLPLFTLNAENGLSAIYQLTYFLKSCRELNNIRSLRDWSSTAFRQWFFTFNASLHFFEISHRYINRYDRSFMYNIYRHLKFYGILTKTWVRYFDINGWKNLQRYKFQIYFLDICQT